MTDYEKGSPAWDIGIILTRHKSRLHGDATDCARVMRLRYTIGRPSRERLDSALSVGCTCGKGDSTAEQTTYRQEKWDKEHPKDNRSEGSESGDRAAAEVRAGGE